MPLNLYRRHQRGCEALFPVESKTGEFEERKRGWKRCGCFIFASGTLSGKFKRKYTGKINWDEAKALAVEWEKSGIWEGVAPAPPPPLPEVQSIGKIGVDDGVKRFLDERSESVAPNTQRKTRYLLNALKVYSDSKGYVLIEQWTTLDVREFRTSWEVAPNTAAKYMEMVKSFFDFALSNGWIVVNPAKSVRNTKGKASDNTKERIPFSDDEIKRMFDACEHQYGKKMISWSRDNHHHHGNGETVNYKYRWTGQDLADFIAISMYTGLRISDVATFHTDRLKENGECHVRTTKTGRKVSTWIPQWLQMRIQDRVAAHGPLIFGTHNTTDVNVITDLWRRKLNRLWGMCGPWKEKPTPHRFRHTFARILLQKTGVTVRDVAELLGDTEDVILRYYGAWVPERQARLTKILQEAFDGKPKLVAIDGGRG